MLLKNIPGTVALPCPACGVYLCTKSGLDQHIHRKHPELEIQARIDFDRAKHCLHGAPICRFCRCRMADWQSMRKHLTQGMCSSIKASMAAGATLEDILAKADSVDQLDPPEPPAAGWELKKPLIQQKHDVLTVPDHQLRQHAQLIKAYTGQCALCNQRIAQPGHIKTHWRTGHRSAWEQAHRAADSLAGSMSAIFSTPCQFCGSQAKDSKSHSRKCPSFFQIAAIRHLRSVNFEAKQTAYTQPSAPKQDKSNPQCKTYVAPMQQALQGQLPITTTISTAPTTGPMPLSTASSTTSIPRSRQDGTIKSFSSKTSGTSAASPTNAPPADPPTEGPWQCRVKLVNPHQLCYVNAGFLAMTYAFQQAGVGIDALHFIIKLLTKAAERGVMFKLTQSLRFRQLIPAWVYDAVQRDSAGYVQQLLQAQQLLSTIWDSRRLGLAGFQLRAQGDSPIPCTCYGSS